MCWLRKFICCVAVFAAIFSFVSPALAKPVVVEADGEYTIGDGDNENPAAAKEFARKNALRRAAEQVSVYVESFSKVQKFKLTADEVLTISASVMKVLNEDFRYEPSLDKKSIRLVYYVKAEVDPSNIDLKSLLEDRKTLNQNIQLEKQVAAQQKEILRLQEENAKANEFNRAEIQRQIEAAQKQFLIKSYEQNLVNAINANSKEIASHYIAEIRKIDPTNAVAQYVIAETADKQTAINDALNVLKLDPENIVACSTLVRKGYQRAHYIRSGIRAVRKNFTPDEIKKMTISAVVKTKDTWLVIYPIINLNSWAILDSVLFLYEIYHGTYVDSLTATEKDPSNPEKVILAKLNPEEVKSFIAKCEREFQVNFSADFPSDFDINNVDDIIITSAYFEDEV